MIDVYVTCHMFKQINCTTITQAHKKTSMKRIYSIYDFYFFVYFVLLLLSWKGFEISTYLEFLFFSRYYLLLL